MNRIIIGAIVLASLFTTRNGNVDDGNKHYKSKKYLKAFKAYKKAEGDLPQKTYSLYYNKGTVLIQLKKFQEAITEFRKGCDVEKRSTRSRCYYNLGTAYAMWASAKEQLVRKGKTGKLKGDKLEDARRMALRLWKSSVEALEQALEWDSKMMAARHNLEIALLRVDPPCEVRDDKYEDNGNAKTAKSLPQKSEKPQTLESLVLCAGDQDWYKLKVKKAGRLFAEISPSKGSGTLGLALWAPDGKKRLRPPMSAKVNIKKLSYQEVTKPGTYYLQVYGLDDAERDYKLTYRVVLPCSEKEDKFEKNNDPASAKTLEGKEYKKMMLCRNDQDWFKVKLKKGEGAKVTIKNDTSEGTLVLKAYDSTGKKLLTTATGKPGEKDLRLNNPGAGTYLLKVAGLKKAESPYQLKVEIIPPCHKREDKYEQNDTPETAKTLKPGVHKKLQVCKGDPDYYKIKLGSDDSLFAIVSFDPKEGKAPRLMMYKVDPLHSTLPKPIGLPTGSKTNRLVVLSAPGAGDYYIKVTGEIGYTLALQKKPPCPKGDDKLEENDTPATAKVLKKDGTLLARICPQDADYFKLALKADHELRATIMFDHRLGDLDLEVHTDDGKGKTKKLGESKKSSAKRPMEGVVLRTKKAQTVYVKVDAKKKAQNFYLLHIKRKKLPPPKPNKNNKNNKKKQDNKNKKKDDKKNQKQDPKQNKKQNDKQNQKQQKKKKKKMTSRRMKDEMFKKKLENMKNKKNLEYEKALRNSPYRHERSRKNW